VPQGAQAPDRTSPTQPFSVGLPSIGTLPLSEARMWGTTFFDQLLCRIEFLKSRYEGPFTPPSTKGTIFYPGYYGGMNWGGVSIHEPSGIAVINDIRMPQLVQLLPRDQLDIDRTDPNATYDNLKKQYEGFSPQAGTPYAVSRATIDSPLEIPCQAPPYGTMSAVDLKSRRMVWQVPMGTIRDSGPLGIKTHVPIPLGMPTLGGPVTTASGLVFYAGTQDYYLRALDLYTGKELWKGRLPVGAQGAPMTYVSPASGRQFVGVSAGGARMRPDRGDYVIAYALPPGR
jgi:quinate dehydrogenase (quinone)